MEKEEKPLVNSDYLLQKIEGKGGWTYAEIPEVLQNKNNPFGWVKVKGWIDDFELKHQKLMPMGNGRLFLPVRAEIRKKIKKRAGDWVRVVLYDDDESAVEIPLEILECFKNETNVLYDTFLSFSESEQEAYLTWIEAAKTEETKARRIAKMMERLAKKLKFYDLTED